MIRLLLLLLCAGPAAAAPTVDASVYGAIVGPLDHELTDDERAGLMREFDRFSDAMLALSEQRWADAAGGFEAVADTTGWFEAAYNAALAHRAGGAYGAALLRTDQALRLRPGDRGTLFLKAGLLQGLGRYADARGVVDGALSSARADAEAGDELLALLNLGAALRLLGEPGPALDAYEQARTLAIRLEAPGLEAAALAGAGYTHAVRGDSASGEAAMRKARAAADRAGDGASFAEVDLSLAGLALEGGDRAAAARGVDSALADAAGFADRGRAAGVLLAAAGLQRDLGQAGPATQSLSRAEALLAGSELHAQLADVLALRGTWALRDGDAAGAEPPLRRALALLQPLQAPLALAAVRLKLARALLERGRLDDAAVQADAALSGLRGTGADDLRRQAHVVRSELRRRSGDLDGAADDLAAASRLAAGAAPSVQARLQAELVLLEAARGRTAQALAADAALSPAARAALPPEVRARVQIQIAYALHGAGRLPEAIDRARAALPDADAEVTDAARQLVVESLLALDRAPDAAAFLREQGEGEGALARRVEGRSALDRFNDAVEAYNTDRFEAAAEGFAAVAADPAQPAERRAEAARNRTSALLLLAEKRAARGEPAGALAARKDAALTGVGADAARAALLALAEEEDAAAAAAWGERAASHAAAAGDSLLEGQAWMAAGDARFEDAPADAAAAYERALSAWGQAPQTLGWRATVTWNLGLLAWNAGDADAARARLQAALVLAREAGEDADAREIARQLKDMD